MALTSNEEMLDALVRHQIYLLRLSKTITAKILRILDATEVELADKIKARLANNKGLLTAADTRKLTVLLNMVRGIRGAAWEQVDLLWQADLKELATAEPALIRGIATTVAPVILDLALPSLTTLKAMAVSSPFEGRTLRQWAKSIQAEDLRRIENQIRMGMIAGEPSDVIARRVMGSARLNGVDGVTEITRRNAEAITRTSVNHISNKSRDLFFGENSDVFDMELFVSTLDSRTTPVCRANDGKVFERGKGPRPPLHMGCRSLRVAMLDDEIIGNRPYKASTEKQLLREYGKKMDLGKLTSRDQIPRGNKSDYDKWARARVRELTGRVPAHTTYQQFLGRQSTAFQNDVLGLTKAKLFRAGLPLDRFVDRSGAELSLSGLAKKHSQYFKDAGLDPAAFT